MTTFASSKWGTSVGALALGSGLFLLPEAAEAQEERAHAVTLGVNVAFSISSRPAFTIGPDIRYSYMYRPSCDATSTSCTSDHFLGGVFFQPTYMMGGAWRFTGGVHGGRLMEKFFYPDAELGISYRTVSTEGAFAGGYGLHVGLGSIFTLFSYPMEHGPTLRANIALSPGMGSEFILGHDFRALGLCHFLANKCSIIIEGRALRYAGDGPVARAAMQARSRRGAQSASMRRSPREGRAALFEHYADAASMECASIPAFKALARDLREAGAPSGLIERALRSARDEHVHTDLMCKLAGGFGDMDLEAVLPPTPGFGDRDLMSLYKRLACESFWDGCVNEGAAAALARRQRAASKDESIRDTLAVIAQDEQGHADLSERIVAFCMEAGGRAVRDALFESIEARKEQVWEEKASPKDEQELAPFGIPTAAMKQAAREEAMETSLATVC